MTTQYLINNVRSGSSVFYAGNSFDSAIDAEQIARIAASGGVLLDSTASLVAASSIATSLRKAGAPPEESQAAMLAGAVASSNAAALRLGATGAMAAAGVTTANAAGAGTTAAPIDHAHAHGNQLGGTLHAAAVAGVSAGFMTAADKTKIDSYPAAVGEAGLEHSVRGIVDSNVTTLASFTVAGNDGLTYVQGDRVGLVDQTTGRDCGVYVVGVVSVGVAPLTRAADWPAAAVLSAGSSMRANEGTAWAGSVWYSTVAGPITVGGTDPDLYPRRQSGTTAAMSTGVAVANVWLKSASQVLSPISTQINTVGGTVGFTTVPGASRTPGRGTGSFAITGDALDTSTIDWMVEN